MYSEGNYIIQSEPDYKGRSYNWKTAIGLQQVDGLVPSSYLIEAANANIKGEITLDEVQKRINAYYEQKLTVTDDESRFEEADKVSLHIAQILSNRTFKLSPVELLSIHRQLFDGVFDHAGNFRDINISKKEWILNDESVVYGDFRTLRESLDYDMNKEKEFNYSGLDDRQTIEHITNFISDLWQVHAFAEGNTRAIAVFTIKYLRAFGYDVVNDTFEKHSMYFRNALVRANYNSNKSNIKATPVYLNRFFGNLLFGENNELRNRHLHINARP